MYRLGLPCVKTHVAEYSSDSLASSLPRPSNYSSSEWGDEKPVSHQHHTRFSITTHKIPSNQMVFLVWKSINLKCQLENSSPN